MKRLVLLFLLTIIVSGAYFLNANRNTDVTVINARGIPLDALNTRFVITFEIQNDGPAKILTGLHSASAQMVHIMNVGYVDAPIVIPADSVGFFAMDGAHVMAMGVEDSFALGTFLPLTLEFAQAPQVTTRVLNVGNEMDMNGMNHDKSDGIQSNLSPDITLFVENGVSPAGADITVNVENFTFVRVADDAPHVSNEGHGHIYLNGLKLGRLYEAEFSLGAVPKGTYELVVALNTNTHQPYMNGGVAVQDTLSFTVP